MEHFPYRSPKEIEALIKQSIVGQDEGVRTVATAFASHLLRIEYNRKHPENPIHKDNLLIIGPTGSGKTESIKTAIRECNLSIPTAVVATNTLTASGYKGKSVETILQDLYQDAVRIIDSNPGKYAEYSTDPDEYKMRRGEAALELANKGIIILDEADKIRIDPRDSRSDTLFQRSMQHQLLKIIEGGTGFGDSFPENEIDTTDILFIFSGAFVGIDEVIRRRLDPEEEAVEEKTIGFRIVPVNPENNRTTAATRPKRNLTARELIPTTEDLIEYGYTPELVGRVTLRCRYNPITVDTLYRILRESKLSPAKESMDFFAEIHNSLEYTKSALMEICRQAEKLKTGARGLRNKITEITYPIYYELSDKTNQRVIITEETVKGEALPIIRPVTDERRRRPSTMRSGKHHGSRRKENIN